MNIVDLDHDIREAMAKIFIKLGIKDTDANVLAEIIRVGRGMCVDDLAKRLEYSISGVTSSLHRLMRMHLIVRSKKGKKYIYRSESSLLCTLLHLIEEIRSHELPALLEKIDKRLKMEDEKNIRNLRERVESADRYLSIIAGILREYSGGENHAHSADLR